MFNFILGSDMTIEQLLSHEKRAIAEYLSQHWQSSVPFSGIVDLVAALTQQECMHTFEALDVSLGAHQAKEIRESQLKQVVTEWPEANLIHYYDTVVFNIDSIDSYAGFIERALNNSTNYDAVCKRTLKAALKAYPNLIQARPHGWEQQMSSDAPVIEFNQDQALKSYGGDTTLPARSPHFVERVGLDYLVYQQKEQGRHPLSCMIGAIYAQLAHVQIKANTQAMIREVSAYANNAPKHPVFGQRHTFTHPALRMISSMSTEKVMPTEDQFRIDIERAKAFDRLPEEERQRIAHENQSKFMLSFDLKSIDEENKADFIKAVVLVEREWGIKAFVVEQDQETLSL